MHANLGPEIARLSYQYVQKHDDEAGLHEHFRRVLFGDYHSFWTDYRAWPSWFYPKERDWRSNSELKKAIKRMGRAWRYLFRYHAQRKRPERIVKIIRGNMMLSWLRSRFDARVVFLVRHPAAVVLSQLKSQRSWNPETRIDRYRSNIPLVDALNAPTRKLLFETLDIVEAITLSWCIENTIALRQAAESGIHVVHYETLVSEGMPEWQKIVSALELPVLPEVELVAQPSQQAWNAQDPAVVKRHARWRGQIDDETRRRIQNILDATETELYRVDQLLPFSGGR